jgi:hypothetical protein
VYTEAYVHHDGCVAAFLTCHAVLLGICVVTMMDVKMIMNSIVKKGVMLMAYSNRIFTSRPVFVFWNWYW